MQSIKFHFTNERRDDVFHSRGGPSGTPLFLPVCKERKLRSN